MPMGIVSDSDFDSESKKLITPVPSTDKTNPTNIPRRTNENKEGAIEGVVQDIKRGRGIGSVEVPNSLRNLIGVTALNESRGDALEFAKQFKISPSSASAYAVGAKSTDSYDERPNSPVISNTKLKIQKVAKRKMMLAMNNITAEKLENTNASNLSTVARNMSAIFKDMEPDNDGSTGKDKQPFVVYSPIVHNENRYEVIVVKE